MFGRHRQHLSTHELGNFDAQFTPKLTEDGWGCEEFPVFSKDHSEYDIWSHSSDLPLKSRDGRFQNSPMIGPSGNVFILSVGATAVGP